MEGTSGARPDPRRTRTLVIWSSLTMATFPYVLLAFVFGDKFEESAAQLPEWLRSYPVAVAVGVGVLSLAAGVALARAAGPHVERRDLSVDMLWQKITIGTLLLCAVSELPVLLGLALFLLGLPFDGFIWFAAITLALHAATLIYRILPWLRAADDRG